jgi:hypothetical protein
MVKEDEMDGICTTKGEMINANDILVSEHERKRPLGKARHRCEENI